MSFVLQCLRLLKFQLSTFDTGTVNLSYSIEMYCKFGFYVGMKLGLSC